MSQIPIKLWMDALVSATNELATTSLGFEEGSVNEEPDCEFAAGSCIALVGEEGSLQMGLGASQENAMKLGRALFGMEPDEEDLSEQDLGDALGEIVNVVAGGVKTRMSEHAVSMQLGLPLLLHGRVDAPSGAEVLSVAMRWDSIEARLLLMRQNGRG